MKHIIILASILVALATKIAAKTGMEVKPCDGNKNSSHPLPALPDQFVTRIEANILQKNYSMEITEYYDYKNNRGVVLFHRNVNETRTIMQFQNLESHIIYAKQTSTTDKKLKKLVQCDPKPFSKDNTCVVRNMTNQRFNIFKFTTDASGGHVKGVKDILMFGKQFGETFIGGDEKIRGIPVEHWQTCLKFGDHEGSFTLDYFFSNSTYNMTYTSQPVPVRAIVQGTSERNGTQHSFNNVYDFFSFKPGPIQDESVFQIPVGVYCSGSVNQKEIPKLPDQFTTGVEQSHVRDFYADKTTEQFYFDYPSQLLRNDYARPVTRDDYFHYGNRPLSVIYDFNSTLVYIIDKWQGNCTVRGVDATLDYRDVDFHMTMRRASSLFNFMNTNYTYQGKKTWRGIPVESWAAYNSSDNHFQEVFFQDPSALAEFPDANRNPPLTSSGGRGPGPGAGGPGAGGGPGPNAPNNPKGPTGSRGNPPAGLGPPVQQVIVGIYDRVVNDVQNMTTRVNFFGFSPGHLEADAFDVIQCYEVGHHYTLMSLKVEESYSRYVSQHQREFYAAVRSSIARGAGVSATRVTNLVIGDEDGSSILVYFKLLDKIKVKGVNVPGPSLEEAKTKLTKSVAAGLDFDVQYPTIEQNFLVAKGSLIDFQPSMTSSSSTSMLKYGPASMAGLAIGMIVLGAILGLLAAYIIYKKVDTSIPYKVTD